MKVFLKVLNLSVFFLSSFFFLAAQTIPVESPSVQEIRKLAAGQRWDELVRLLEPIHSRTPDMIFYYGMALARLERWPEAESALQSGQRLVPADPRFPIELAGIAFRQKQYPQATHLLKQAIKLAPSDSYANDFLGTIYFLDGNLEASLKYWNRAGKPEIAEVRDEPTPRISPALLDQAFVFSPASSLRLPELLDTDRRIRGLGIFSQYHFDLLAREDGKFNLVFRSQERNGFGNNKWEALFLLFRGLPFQGLDPEFYNLHREAINIVSLFRWDPQKRRIFAQLSGPFERSAKYRYQIITDDRNENWVLRNSFTGPAPALASLNVRHELLAFDLSSYASERWRWSVGAEVSHRDFRSVVPGAVLTPDMLAAGYQLKQQMQLAGTLWRLTERRFTVDADATSQTARLWSRHEESFEILQSSLDWRWFPRAEGNDFETAQQIRAGKTFGQAPFDELFMLGIERDNNLPMRAHIGTRDGRKGSAPLGRAYFLALWETDKIIYGNGIITTTIGPFLDTGKIADPSSLLGSHQWLWDTGAQVKLHVFGRGVGLSYGKDLRSGNNAFYVTLIE